MYNNIMSISNKQMSIVEAYIKFRKQLVILISGLSGSGISHLAKNISKDLKLQSLSYAKFCKQDYNKTATLPNGETVINWDTDDVIDWAKFNVRIKELKKSGVVAFSPAFPTDRLDKDLEVDAHIHIKLSKQNLFAKRQKYVQEHKEECKELAGRKDEYLIFNKLSFPYYLSSIERSKITKFINANEFVQLKEEEYDNKLAEESFNYLMNIIGKWLEKYNESVINKNFRQNIQQNKQSRQNNVINSKLIRQPTSESDFDGDEDGDENYSEDSEENDDEELERQTNDKDNSEISDEDAEDE